MKKNEYGRHPGKGPDEIVAQGASERLFLSISAGVPYSLSEGRSLNLGLKNDCITDISGLKSHSRGAEYPGGRQARKRGVVAPLGARSQRSHGVTSGPYSGASQGERLHASENQVSRCVLIGSDLYDVEKLQPDSMSTC